MKKQEFNSLATIISRAGMQEDHAFPAGNTRKKSILQRKPKRVLRRDKDDLFQQLLLQYSKPGDFLHQYPVGSRAEGCELLARLLELDIPVSDEVFFAVVRDFTYFEQLLVSRAIPVFLRTLLQHPPH